MADNTRSSFTEPGTAPGQRTYRTQGALGDFHAVHPSPGQTVGSGHGFGLPAVGSGHGFGLPAAGSGHGFGLAEADSSGLPAGAGAGPGLPARPRAGEPTDAMHLETQADRIQEAHGRP